MKSTYLIKWLACIVASPANVATADLIPQPQVAFTQASSVTWNADWQGVAGRTYFAQGSVDLINWEYLPAMEFGAGFKQSVIQSGAAKKYFIRLRFVDAEWVTTLQQARDADFDNDGIPNWFEVEQAGSDPLKKNDAGGDLNGNGLPDGWELFHFGGVGIADPNVALQPDGLTNKEKAELGLDPNQDYSDPTAASPSKYNYDLVGRLTGVTAPVGGGIYTPDEEGNLLNAQ